MRKIIVLTLLSLLIFPFMYSQNYRISETDFSTKGKFKFTTTKSNILERNYPLDKKRVFDEEQLNKYLKNYEQDLHNSRFFEQIFVSYELTGLTEVSKSNPDETVSLIKVIVSVVDSNHFLLVPYAKFKDDKKVTNFNPRLKAKDTNFLGTMNPLSSDFNLDITYNKNSEEWSFEPGFNFDFDYPFKAGLFNITWVNSYGIDYTIGNTWPDWDFETGFKFELPFDKFKLELSVLQYSYSDNDYAEYNDQFYFNNEFIFSTPVSLYKFSNYSTLTYTPSVDFNFNWDSDGINENNENLLGPSITFSHSLSNSKINWFDTFRKGYSISLSNSWPYNFHTKEWSPSVSIEGQFFRYIKLEERNYLDAAGLAIDLYAFTYIPFPNNFDNSISGYGQKIGNRLRGITDDTYFGNDEPSYTTSTAVVMNFDFPINFIRTTFKHDIINFTMQVSPFMDIAIYRDRKLPLQTDSVICLGMEGLVYPYKWSSFTIRGSLGFDMKSAIAEDNLIKGLWHNKEFTIGLGLHY